jgi:putative transposase
MEVMPDHVHIFIKATPNDSPVFIISQLKGFTSFTLRNEFRWLKSRIPTIWTRSYYVETVGIFQKQLLKNILKTKKQNKTHAIPCRPSARLSLISPA